MYEFTEAHAVSEFPYRFLVIPSVARDFSSVAILATRQQKRDSSPAAAAIFSERRGCTNVASLTHFRASPIIART